MLVDFKQFAETLIQVFVLLNWNSLCSFFLSVHEAIKGIGVGKFLKSCHASITCVTLRCRSGISDNGRSWRDKVQSTWKLRDAPSKSIPPRKLINSQIAMKFYSHGLNQKSQKFSSSLSWSSSLKIDGKVKCKEKSGEGENQSHRNSILISSVSFINFSYPFTNSLRCRPDSWISSCASSIVRFSAGVSLIFTITSPTRIPIKLGCQ